MLNTEFVPCTSLDALRTSIRYSQVTQQKYDNACCQTTAVQITDTSLEPFS